MVHMTAVFVSLRDIAALRGLDIVVADLLLVTGCGLFLFVPTMFCPATASSPPRQDR
jgi:hypothetical protein